MSTAVRLAVPNDAAAIAAVHTKTWQAAYAGVIDQTYLDGLEVAPREAMWRRSLKHGRAPGAIFVADGDGALAGFIAVGTYRGPSGEQDESAGEVFAIYVDPGHWSTGLGRALMDAGVERLSAHGLREVRLWVLADNPRGRRFYERYGFVTDGETRIDDVGGRPVEEVRYTLAVG
jgi:ribosomal protein S18 acetylase RimI-like enzyme